MKHIGPDNKTGKSGGTGFPGTVVLIICLSVLALRSTFTESPHIATVNPSQLLTNQASSMIISSVLLFAGGIYVLAGLFRRKPVLYRSGIEWGMVIFLGGAIIALAGASNRRIAINDIIFMAAPMLAAVALSGLPACTSRIKLVLIVIIALGITASFQCFDQAQTSNAEMIRQYQQNPAESLRLAGGVEYGSLKHFMFEHRLYSRDIRGFLTTGNSTGSFLLIAAFAAVGLIIQKIKDIKRQSSPAELIAGIVCYTAAVLIILAGLVLTHSKGALTAAGISALMLAVYLLLGGYLYRYRRVIILLAVLAVPIAAAGITVYGVRHGRLPGGNSMLVRWQYWIAAVRMIAEHPAGGVGPGNFAIYYFMYKVPAAIETVKDPHNFVLSLLSQYGPLGLVGFLCAVFVPVYKGINTGLGHISKIPEKKPAGRLFAAVIVSISVVLLTARPVLMAVETADNWETSFYVFIAFFVLPLVVFLISSILLYLGEIAGWRADGQSGEKTGRIAVSDYRPVKAALICGVLGVLIHNIIDFAIFEPANLTLLWMVLACIAGIDNSGTKHAPAGAGRFIKPVHAVLIAVLLFAAGYYGLVPTVRSGLKTQQAIQQPYTAYLLLADAIRLDPLNPEPSSLSGRWCLQKYDNSAGKYRLGLETAAAHFRKAASLNPADFDNYEKLCDVYTRMAADVPAEQKNNLLNTALDCGGEAIKRYPGSEKLHLKLGGINEQLGQTQAALKHYRKAVQIEQDYREMFAIMYPGLKLFSRLGQQNYQDALEKIKQLENHSDKTD